jgi:uncharacterized protein YggE
LDDHRVAVTGQAHGEIAPDRLEWTLLVVEADADPRAAFARCAERLRMVSDALPMAQVTTGAVAVSAQRVKGEPTGRHEARAALTAVASLELAGEVAAAAMEAGADELQGPHLRTPGTEAVHDDLLAAAVQAARRRAERAAGAAGRRLGRALQIRDSQYFDDDYEVAHGMAMSRGGAEPPVIPRPQRISATAAVVFELLD